jgi:hypothetical protein
MLRGIVQRWWNRPGKKAIKRMQRRPMVAAEEAAGVVLGIIVEFCGVCGSAGLH